MIIRDRSYPHPVLTPSRDDVTPNEFECQVTVDFDADNFYVNATFNYHNESLSQLVASGKAAYCVHVECRRNYFREIFVFSQPASRFVVRTCELIGQVEVSGFIKSQALIESYRIAGAHPDYGDISFQVQPGDILAVAPTVTFDAYVDYDPLRNIASILSIERSDATEKGEMAIDITGPQIVAILSQQDYDRYTDLKADPMISPILANQVVVPVILEAIHQCKSALAKGDDLAEWMDKRWFRSINKKLEDAGVDVTKPEISAFSVTQKLLELPLRRSLEELHEMNPTEEGK